MLWLAALIAAVMGAPAWADTLQEVTVEADGKDASEARTLAITKGQADAFNAIAQQQLSAEMAKRIIDTTKPEQISHAVEGFEVVNEKITDNHYAATFRFTFNDDKLVALFKPTLSAAAPIAQPADAPTLMLPLLRQGGQVMLWEESNGWREAWNHVTPPGNTSLLRIPLGDLTDMRAADAAAALAGDCAKLAPLAKRYGADEVMVALAQPIGTAQSPALKVSVQRFCLTAPSEPTSKQYSAQAPGETLDMIYYQAARDIIGFMKIRSASTGLKTPVQGLQTQIMLAPLRSASDWVTLRNRIKSISSVTEVELLAISPTQADLSVSYKGKPDEIRSAMEQQGVRVSPSGDYWALSLR